MTDMLFKCINDKSKTIGFIFGLIILLVLAFIIYELDADKNLFIGLLIISPIVVWLPLIIKCMLHVFSAHEFIIHPLNARVISKNCKILT